MKSDESISTVVGTSIVFFFVAVAFAMRREDGAWMGLGELFEAMKTIVAPDLHEKLAHLLIESRCVTKSGREDERAVAEIAASFQLRVAQSRRSAVALQ